jgi:hypothetical protein
VSEESEYLALVVAEEAAVFAVELTGAFISDLEGRTCGIETPP